MKKIDTPLITKGKGHKNQNSSRGKMFGYQVLGFGSGGSVKLNDVGIDILLVAGGGGGGAQALGGGGGGGVVLIPAPNGTVEALEVQTEAQLTQILEWIVQLIQLPDNLLQKAEEEIVTQEDLVVDHQEEVQICLVMLFKVVKQENQDLLVLALVVL